MVDIEYAKVKCGDEAEDQDRSASASAAALGFLCFENCSATPPDHPPDQTSHTEDWFHALGLRYAHVHPS